MKNFILLFVFLFLSIEANSYDKITSLNDDTIQKVKYNNDKDHSFIIGWNSGVSCSSSDYALLFSTPVSFSLDYHLKNGYYLQIAPKYSYLYKWKEYYLTLPLHVRKRFSKRLSLFAGPCITWEIPYFKDLGISAGVYFHINKNSSIILSVFTFTLWDYNIDYRFIPIGIFYNYSLRF